MLINSGQYRQIALSGIPGKRGNRCRRKIRAQAWTPWSLFARLFINTQNM